MEDDMAQYEMEVILARHLAENLALPMFIVDPEGNLIFFNESAEAILGLRFGTTGLLPASEWSTMFEPVDQDGNSIDPEEMPLMIAMMHGHPAHRGFWIKGLDEKLRQLEVTAVPLIGQAGHMLGAMAIFWEVPS
jgi:PAS domain-containing protein